MRKVIFAVLGTAVGLILSAIFRVEGVMFLIPPIAGAVIGFFLGNTPTLNPEPTHKATKPVFSDPLCEVLLWINETPDAKNLEDEVTSIEHELGELYYNVKISVYNSQPHLVVASFSYSEFASGTNPEFQWFHSHPYLTRNHYLAAENLLRKMFLKLAEIQAAKPPTPEEKYVEFTMEGDVPPSHNSKEEYHRGGNISFEFKRCLDADLSYEMAEVISFAACGMANVVNHLISQAIKSDYTTPEEIRNYITSLGCWHDDSSERTMNALVDMLES